MFHGYEFSMLPIKTFQGDLFTRSLRKLENLREIRRREVRRSCVGRGGRLWIVNAHAPNALS